MKTPRKAVEPFSKKNTKQGEKNMQALTKGMPWEKAKPLWTNLSAEFAHGASGTAHVFHNGVTGINIQSVWGVTEYPILQSKGINIIYHVILP